MKQTKRLSGESDDSARKKKRKEEKLKSKESKYNHDEITSDLQMSYATSDADSTKTKEYKKRRRKLQKQKKREGSPYVDGSENQTDVTMATEDTVKRQKQTGKEKHEKKLGKKIKKSTQVNETNPSEPSQPTNQTPDADAAERQLKEKIREKKREKRRKKKLQKEAEKAARLQGKPVCELALKYLNTFVNDRDSWKFCKVRQVWLLQHMYSEKIPEKDFQMLLEYLRGLQGNARTQTITKAESILQSCDQDSDDSGVVPSLDEKSKQIAGSTNETLDMETKLVRAKEVVQLLS